MAYLPLKLNFPQNQDATINMSTPPKCILETLTLLKNEPEKDDVLNLVFEGEENFILGYN
ncbi:hypothetical protein [Pseudoalteromonas denitrificans]|uniref:Uncharacterized protein n=1 Tax=Pseudoalteromonas denitrificans DSM 6059 TaxID=1123010 RepID=A0A1I1Q6P3_9GAMM|nr:hypothetical protein [Pseudoalteromonas denitrificans]SFD14893.1 hypothetical protein SAMN02745724_03665 [Pseudoalteromonas denitrificans DSM 6059]